MAQQASVIATLTEDPGESLLDDLPSGVECLEVRADLVDGLEAARLRRIFPGRLLYTLRSRAEGGGFEGSRAQRREKLLAAADDFDLIDLEMDRDLHESVLAGIPAAKRLLSWHGSAGPVSTLVDRFREVESVPAHLYKFVPAAREAQEETAPLEFLHSIQRRDVLAFAGGEGGVWTRYVAPYLGAPVLYGAFGSRAGAPGQPTVERICGDFGFPEMRTIEWVAGIVGNPVGHSLSPRLHNGAYRALGIPALFLPFQPERFGDFWLEVLEGGLFRRIGWRFAALSVTAPFKSLAVAVAGAVSPLARAIDSANTLVSKEGVWEAESTDPSGVVGPLQWRGIELASKRAAVVGCGGAGRAAAAGLARAGCRVTLVNRTVDRGREVAESLRLDFVGLEDLEPGRFDIVVNATSLGHDEDDPLPFEVDDIGSDGMVVDLVYGEQPTMLALRCRRRGLLVVEGREVLLHQAIEQFRLMTGRDLPVELGRQLLALEEAE